MENLYFNDIDERAKNVDLALMFDISNTDDDIIGKIIDYIDDTQWSFYSMQYANDYCLVIKDKEKVYTFYKTMNDMDICFDSIRQDIIEQMKNNIHYSANSGMYEKLQEYYRKDSMSSKKGMRELKFYMPWTEWTRLCDVQVTMYMKKSMFDIEFDAKDYCDGIHRAADTDYCYGEYRVSIHFLKPFKGKAKHSDGVIIQFADAPSIIKLIDTTNWSSEEKEKYHLKFIKTMNKNNKFKENYAKVRNLNAKLFIKELCKKYNLNFYA